MFLSARLRSSVALVLVLGLVGSTTVPLVLCAFEGAASACVAETSEHAAPPDSCHERHAPTSSLSCCCDPHDATTPASAPIQTTTAPSVLSVVASPVDGVSPSRPVVPVAAPDLPVRTQALFTLHSALLL
jgi:hypothetical protein